MRMHARKAHAARTFARNLPDEWGDPSISSAFEHVEKVRHENSKSISTLSNPPFDRRDEVVGPARIFALDLHLPNCSGTSSSM